MMDGFSWFIGVFCTVVVLVVLWMDYSITAETVASDAVRAGYMKYRGAYYQVRRAEIKFDPSVADSAAR